MMVSSGEFDFQVPIVDVGELIAESYRNFGSRVTAEKIDRLRFGHRIKVVQVRQKSSESIGDATPSLAKLNDRALVR